MTYKKKFMILSTITAALALAYILGIVFEPERRGSRATSFVWMDSRAASRVDAVTIQAQGNTVALSLKNGVWYVSHNGADYPAKQLRVADFINLFTRRASYQIAANSEAAHARFGLDEASAARVTFSGGAGAALLDVLIGQADIIGKNVYMRKAGAGEVRSGEDVFTSYLSGDRPSWYNLRLIPETEDGTLGIDQVQRLTVYPPSGDSARPQVFTRSGGEWTLGGADSAGLDMGKIDSYVRDILNTEGDNFVDTASGASELNAGRIVLELGSGEIKSLRFGSADEATNHRAASASGSNLLYSLPEWAASRLFYDAAHFNKTAETEAASAETETP